MSSTIPKETPVWIVNEPPVAEIKPETFKLTTHPIPEVQDGEVLVKVEYLSNEPAQRGWIDATTDPRRMYTTINKKGEPVRSIGMGTILKSKSEKWKEGQQVTGNFAWYQYGVVSEDAITSQAVKLPNFSDLISLSTLGLTGLTAWAGIYDMCDLNPESVLVVSGAAGAVGSVVVQIAKNVIGCKKVVGIAGGKAKCDWVKSLGADACIDYKSANWKKDLADELPDYADVYFDNVGGVILNEMLGLTKRYGKIICCGVIANYHGQPLELPNFREIIFNRLNIHGFILMDHKAKFPQAIKELVGWVQSGKINATEAETVVETRFEDVPKTWQMLFEGGNRGKLITKLI